MDRDARLAEAFDQGRLLFRIEAEITVDAENKELLAVFFAGSEQLLPSVHPSVAQRMEARPHLAEPQIGIGIKSADEFFPLIEHVAFDLVAQPVP